MSIFAVALLVLAAWTSWFEWQNRQNIRQSARVELAARADALTGTFLSTFQVVENTLVAVVTRRQENLRRNNGIDREVQTTVEALGQFIGQIRSLVVFDQAGNSVYDSTAFPAPPVNVADRDYFVHFSRTDHGNGRDTFLGSPVIGRTSGTWFLSMSREVINTDGRFAGVALGVIDIGFLQRLLRESRRHEDAALALVTADNVIVAAYVPGDETSLTGKRLEETRMFGDIAARISAASSPYGVFDGDETLTSVAPVSGMPVRIVMMRTWDKANSQWHASLSRQLFLLAGTLIVLFLVWAPVSRVIRDRDRLFTLSPDPVCVLEADGRFLSVNPAWETTLGLPRAEIIGQPVLDFIDSEDRNRLADILLRLSVGGRVEEFTLCFRDRANGQVYLSMVAVAENNRVFAIARNVTQRLLSEEALRRSEQRFRDVAEASGEFIWETDGGGMLVFVTERARTALGVPASDLIGRSLADLIGESDRPRVAAALRRYSPFHYEVETRRANGGRVILRLSGVPVVDGSDRLTGFRGAALDVTERRQARQALLESEARFRSIVNTVIDGILTVDEYGVIESVNPATERMFEFSAREMIGQNVSILFSGETALPHQDFMALYSHSGEQGVLGNGREILARRKSGQEFPLELGVSEVWFGGKRLFIGVCRDISERKRIDRLKDEFVSTVSHELRTPLTSIRGALGLINGGAVGELPPKARGLVSIAYSNSERLITLVNDILDMQKIESGRMVYDMRPLDLGVLLRRAVTEINAFAVQYGVAVDLAVPEGPAVMVQGDADRLVQVSINLLSNAIKFSPDGGAVTVTLRDRDGRAEVLVCDQGPGIPEEFQPQIFQKFSQADATDTRAKGGTGLGLSIAKAIVDHHHGAITFETVAGQGTTFVLSLPVLPSPEQDTRLLDTSASGSSELSAGEVHGSAAEEGIARSLLVVEDDPVIADLLTEYLQQDGYRVSVAPSVTEAREMLGRSRFDGITLDLMLPDGDGLTLVDEMRRQGSLGQVPVVVVSAIADDRRIRGEALGIHDWVRKPIDPDVLLASVHRAIPGSRSRARALYVEDDSDLRQTLRAVLSGQVDLTGASTVQDARRILAQGSDLDLVLLDLQLPDGRGEELFPDIRAHPAHPAVVILSGLPGAPPADAMVAAALVKSRVSNDELVDIVRTLIRGRRDKATAKTVVNSGDGRSDTI